MMQITFTSIRHQVIAKKTPIKKHILFRIFLILNVIISGLYTTSFTRLEDHTCPLICTCTTTSFHNIGSVDLDTIRCQNVSEHSFNTPCGVEAILLDDNKISMTLLQTIITEAENLTVLGLSNNHIYSLTEWTSYVPTLLMLNLNDNHLDYLSNHLIRHIKNLQWLTLVNNNLEVIETGAFSGLMQLQYLNMSHNRIFEIKRQWCYDMAMLNTLDLTDNTITVIWDNLFEGCSHMRELYLTSNHVAHLYDNALHGLQLLNVLALNHNHLHILPIHAFRTFANISLVDLSANYFNGIPTHAFDSVNIRRLKLNCLNSAKYIYQQSFYNLSKLLVLEIENSPSLVYIDEDAFMNVPHLTSLKVRNNKLITFQNNIITSLPSLKSIELDGNKFNCDCSTRWILYNTSQHLVGVHNFVCQNYSNITSTPTSSTSINDNGCPPTVVPLSLDTLEFHFGENVLLQCRSTGFPNPTVNWLYSRNNESNYMNLSSIYNDSNEILYPRVSLSIDGDLTFHFITNEDAGKYKCEGRNSLGTDNHLTTLHVINTDLHIIVTHTTSSSITVTWKRCRYRGDGSNDYHIRYKDARTNISESHMVNLRPYMRSYTANRLVPNRQYEFCIMSKYQQHNVIVNCTFVYTQRKSLERIGVFNARSWIIGIGVSAVCVSLLMSCTISLCVKRYNVKRKRRRHDPYGDNSGRLCLSSVDSISDMSPITYENKSARLCEDDDENDDLEPVFDTAIDEDEGNMDDVIMGSVNINKYAT